MTTHEEVIHAEVFWNAYNLAKNLREELDKATDNLGEEPDLNKGEDNFQDADDMEKEWTSMLNLSHRSHDQGYIDGLNFALKLFNKEEKANSLIDEISIAVDIIENHHVNCDWMAEPDLNAEITETCAEFAEIYGKDETRLICHDHDKLREWSKMLKDTNTIPYITCDECRELRVFTEIRGELGTYNLCPNCYKEAVKGGNLDNICE